MQEQGGWVYIVLVCAALWIAYKVARYWIRRNYLIDKYGRDVGLKILARSVWQGMSAEQLTDSWGPPVDRDTTVYKTKTKQTWKYNQTGKNRFKDRIFLEDGEVVGWKD